MHRYQLLKMYNYNLIILGVDNRIVVISISDNYCIHGFFGSLIATSLRLSFYAVGVTPKLTLKLFFFARSTFKFNTMKPEQQYYTVTVIEAV